MKISVRTADFDLAQEIAELRSLHTDIGAIASFTGLVRDSNNGNEISAMTLEHYPSMSTKVLSEIVLTAKQNWQVIDATIIHRIGRLLPGDQIVLVAVAAPHRRDAFQACEFIMDFLKTSAPFWKQEETLAGSHWVEERATDATATQSWISQIDASKR